MIWQFHSTRIFGGEYGSVEENQLEESLDQHEEMRNRIVEANFKWKQAQLMVDYAFKQLNEAVTKWKSLTNIDPGKLEERYPRPRKSMPLLTFTLQIWSCQHCKEQPCCFRTEHSGSTGRF